MHIIFLDLNYICFADDLSYKKIASQLHTFPGTRYDAGNAVDRNTTTCMRTIDIGPSSPYLTVWWKVDLGGIYNIHSIAILFRNYDGWGIYFCYCQFESFDLKLEQYYYLLFAYKVSDVFCSVWSLANSL